MFYRNYFGESSYIRFKSKCNILYWYIFIRGKQQTKKEL